MKRLNTKAIQKLRIDPYSPRSNGKIRYMENWIEGVECVGYWEEGQSFIFKHRQILEKNKYICITLDYLWECIKEIGKNEKTK